jgi:histidine triad (HIT) family protein
MPSIFSKIVKGEIPCYKIAEDEKFLAFLDINPLSMGHALVIPKEEIDYIFDLNDELYNEMFLFAKKVSKAIGKSVKCIRIGLVVYGLDVPHAHIHLIPLLGNNDIDFNKPKIKLSDDEFVELSKKINSEFLL